MHFYAGINGEKWFRDHNPRNTMSKQPTPIKKFPTLIEQAQREAKQRGLPLRVMLQDEARFGRINEPKRCWAPKGIRPVVLKQTVREYTYAYGAVSPVDGVCDFLILPTMDSYSMNLFLVEVSQRHPDEFILMIYDQAPSHSKSALASPERMMVATLPPYCPQLNPVEHVWDELREKYFPNLIFDDMTQLEETLIEGLLYFEAQSDIVQSITGFHWIVCNV